MDYAKHEFRLTKRQLLAGGTFVVLGSSVSKPLSSRQDAILIGNILGDGHLQLSENGKKTRLRFNHSIKQSEYVEWQYKELGWLCEGVSRPK